MIINFIKLFLLANRYRIGGILIGICMCVVLLNIHVHANNNYYVYHSFSDGGFEIYVLKEIANNSDMKYKVYKFTEPQNVINSKLILEETSDVFIGLCIAFGLYYIFLIITFFEESWDIGTCKVTAYKKQITRHKDIDYIYYVLYKKVLKKLPNTEDGLYSDNIEHLNYEIKDYIENRNIFDDFKGTLMEQRDKAFNDILND